jgi:UDP:flavonoid glycosyltransferase YjiC (YdhE family)
MRILFVANPVLSHVFPMMPLAWASRAYDHDVLVATSGVAEAVSQAGLPVVDVAPGFDTVKWEEELARKYPDVRDLTALQAHGMKFAVLNDVLYEGTMELAETWHPDLVIYSEITVMGAMVAARCGVPSVRHDIEICNTSPMLGHLVDVLTSAFGHADVPGARMPAHVISLAPPSLAQPGRPSGWPMRYVPFNGGMVLPSWLRQPPLWPRIAVTEGTSTPGDESGRLRRVIAAASDLDAEFVLAVNPAVVSGYEPLPANVQAPGWVPLAELLKSSAALIHHGGAGTTMSALYAGVPQLMVPDDVPRHLNTEAVRAQGAALTAHPEQIDANLLRRLTEDTSLAEGCARLRAEIMAMPAPAQVVRSLERLTE